VKACAEAHDGVTRLLREGVRFDKYLVTTSCRSCRDPYCLIGCPVDAIHRKGDLQIIIEDHCVGCGRCAENCPYGNINMHEFDVVLQDLATKERVERRQLKATVCDLCDDQCLGENEVPSCVYACPHDAAHRVDGESFFNDLVPTAGARAPERPSAVGAGN
jgi:Fe-S-cluster-containing hydrogenase component 2